MRPTYEHSYKCCAAICFFLLAFTSCQVQQEKVFDDPNIRVIELEREVPEVTDLELKANREELVDFDCDVDWILFGYNSSQLTETAKFELNKVSKVLNKNNKFKARIRAYTDSKGRPEYNQKLSRRRALSAKKYLMSKGVYENNISIDAYSEAKPIAKNTEDDSGRKFNRRIELFVLDKLNNTVCRSHPPEIPETLKVESQ